MSQIKKILFPVDFSASCQGAARYVEAFAGRFEAEIMLLHAVSMGEHNLAEELFPRCEAQLAAYLTDELKYYTCLLYTSAFTLGTHRDTIRMSFADFERLAKPSVGPIAMEQEVLV